MNTKTYCAIFGPLTFETAAHVGVGRGNVGTDSPLRRNGRGELALPGTALGGALRSLATRLASRMELKGKRGVCLALMSGEERKRQKKRYVDAPSAVCSVSCIPARKGPKRKVGGPHGSGFTMRG